ncbi:MAG: hypothetical protein AAF327_18970 [Cyanobacteria bacterium P01_A01_bin.37]
MENLDNYRGSFSRSIPVELKDSLIAIAEHIQTIAQHCEGDEIALLTLLRTLESSHREICDSFFQDALPKSRHQLYSLLREIESEGGWPYIPRMKVRSLLEKINPDVLRELEIKPDRD